MYISVADGGETFESENRRDGDSGGTVEDKSPERGYAAHGRIAPVAFGSCRFWKREFLKRTHGNAMFDVYRNNALRGSVVSVLILISCTMTQTLSVDFILVKLGQGEASKILFLLIDSER